MPDFECPREEAMRRLQALTNSIALGDSGRPRRMLASYLCNIGRGPSAVRGMILSDIIRFTDLGADTYVCDLIQTLKLFDRACSDAV